MLLQSHLGTLDLLPALPRAWPEGKVLGLRARGGCTVAVEWKGGRLAAVTLQSAAGGPVKLRYAGGSFTAQLRAGVPLRIDGRRFR
jgi:alpha-L-fucosidase 2